MEFDLELPDPLLEWLEKTATERNISVAELILELIQNHTNEQTKTKCRKSQIEKTSE